MENFVNFSFVDHSIDFECKYPRKLDIDEVDFDVIGTNTQIDNSGMEGNLPYKLEVDVANAGQMTAVTITALHNLSDKISAKLVKIHNVFDLRRSSG